MTYLQMVNNVLKRLRERQVSTVEESTYSSLIAVYVNDALREVNDAWDWSGLRTTLTATTTADVFAYELEGSQNRIEILNVWNDTNDNFLTYRDAAWFTKELLSASPASGSPLYYSFNGVSSDGDTQVEIYPIPNAAYTIRFNVIQREADLENDSDTTSVPTHPIVLLAYAKAVEERGEDGAIGSSAAYLMAQKSISDYIGMDAAKHPEETIWKEV